jgi:MFS family permease
MISMRTLREKTAWRATAPAIFLVFNSFVWYILTYAVFDASLNGSYLLETERLSLFTVYYVGVAASAIIGSKFFSRARTKFLYLWLFMGAIATILLTTVSSNSLLANTLFAFFLGVSIGVGLPSCLSYFAASTSVENRGFIGGIIWSALGFAILFFALVINMLGPWETIIVQWGTIVALMSWRLFGGIGFLALNRKHEKLAEKSAPSYLELIRKREVLLYLFPWVMFSLINFAEAPILESVFGADFIFVQLIEYAFIGIFAIVGGAIADFIGRKRVVIAGFVMLGIEYAALSVFFDSPVTLYLFLTLDGITWGLFASVFFMALWGDLGENREKEKYYLLGGLPYLLAGFLPILIRPYASAISPTAAFSFASFFLFLAVIPLMYAHETLPEKKIKERELKSYIEKAKKEAAKAQKKEEEDTQRENEDAEVEFEVNQEDYEEALKEAEKYY